MIGPLDVRLLHARLFYARLLGIAIQVADGLTVSIIPAVAGG